MALTNADRQRLHRARQKELLHATRARPLIEVLWEASKEAHLLECCATESAAYAHFAVDYAGVLSAVSRTALGNCHGDLAETLGGPAYMAAVAHWRGELMVWRRSRRKDKGDPPAPPPIPARPPAR